MKKLCILLLVLFTSTTFAQDKKLSFGLNLFPNLSVPFIVTNSNAPFSNPSIGDGFTTPAYSAEKFSYSANAFVLYAVSERFKLNGGIGKFGSLI